MTEPVSLPVQIDYAVSAALKPVLGEDEFETLVDDRTKVMEVTTDDWTVHIEWEAGLAWLAIDDEPDDPAKFEQARRAVMSEAAEQAWHAVDAELSGFLVDALSRSGDPFSIAFAQAITTASPSDNK